MKKVIIIVLVLLVCTSISFAYWEHIYGDSLWDHAFWVELTADSGYILTGFTMSYGIDYYYDFYLVKTDSVGGLIWQKAYGSPEEEWSYCVKQTTDGGYAMVGYTRGFGFGYPGDIWLVKTDATGDTSWTNTYGGANFDCGYSLAQTTDGGYIIAGWTQSFGAGFADVYLVKTDALGNLLWERTFGTALHDRGYSVAQTTDGGYIIAGVWSTSFAATNRQLILIKTDASGTEVWSKMYGAPTSPPAEQWWGYSVVQTTDGGYAITGTYYHESLSDLSDIFLMKTDSTGDSLWTHKYSYPPSSSDWAHALIQTTDGGYAIAGKHFPGNVWFIKTNASGTLIYDESYGPMDSQGECVQQVSDSCYIIAGFSSDNGGDAYLVGSCGETPCVPPDSFELVNPSSEYFADCSMYVNFEWTSPIEGTPTMYYALYVDGYLIADSLTDTHYDDGWYYNTGDIARTVNWYVVAFNDCGTKTSMVWKFYIQPCVVCAPAVAWIECPLPCGNFSACENQVMIFGIADTTGVVLDTTRVYSTIEIYHTDDTADTVYLSEDTDSLSFICAPTGCDSVSVVLNGFIFESDDSVIFTLDSLYNVDDCLTIP